MKINAGVRIWLFLIGYLVILFTSSILFREVEFRLVRLALTYTIVLIYILFIVSSHNMLIGLKPNSRVFNLLIFVPILIIVIALNFYDLNWTDLYNHDPWTLILMIIVLFMQCSSEEFIFRGLLFRDLFSKSGNLLSSAVISSVIFSLFHLLSISKTNDYTSIINQLIVAFVIGLFLAGIYAVTNSIWMSVLTHMVLNFSAYTGRIINGTSDMIHSETLNTTIEWSQVLFALIFYFPYALVALLLLRRSRKDLNWG